MDRYFIDPYEQRAKKNVTSDQRKRGVKYALYDRRSAGEPIAKTMDADIAQRIVALLNEDDRKKGTAK